MHADGSHAARWTRRLGLIAGPIAGVIAYLALDLDHDARATAGIGLLMAIWWMSEAIPLPVTALLPLVLFPLLGVSTIDDAAAPYADDLIFLFMGGFILGLALERWGMHKRIALGMIALVGTGPRLIIAGFMIASALLSMFISNTATTMMLLPIGTSIVAIAAAPDERGAESFGVCLLLGIAYAASIGGIATINGTPPNGILVAVMEDTLGRDIGWAEFMRLGLPVTLVMLPLAWLFLTFVAFPVRLRALAGGRAHIRASRASLGRITRPEVTVLVVFLVTATLWISRKDLAAIQIGGVTPLANLNDAVIAMFSAILLFLLPVGEGRAAMDWTTARRLPWGILLLFGGGLSLAGAVKATGLDEAIGGAIGSLGTPPLVIALLVVALLMVFLTEVTSNTAVTSALLPVIAAAAPGLGVEPAVLMVPAALCASLAFMLPVATPPNAIVFSHEHVTIGRMARAGLGLNLIGVAVVTLLAVLWFPRVLGG